MNGSQITCYTADDFDGCNIRLDYAAFDGCRVPDMVIRPVLLGSCMPGGRGHVIWVGPASKALTAAYRSTKARYKAPATKTGIIPADILQEFRETMPAKAFAREFLCHIKGL